MSEQVAGQGNADGGFQLVSCQHPHLHITQNVITQSSEQCMICSWSVMQTNKDQCARTHLKSLTFTGLQSAVN